MNQHYSRMYGRSHQLATWLVKWARVEWKRCGVLHILEWNRCGTQNGMNIVKRYSYYTWTAASCTVHLYTRGAGHGSVLLRARVAMNTSISHCYKYFYGHNFCSTALQHCRTHGLRQIKFVLVVVLVMNTITKYFFPTWTTACVLKCQPSPHCTERGCKVFRRKNDSTIGDVRPSSSKTTLHFQTQKRLYNCRCPSVIITFFKIFSRKNDSTFVNVRPWSSLSSKLILLINWKKFSSHLSVFSDAIKGRLQKKKKEGRGLMRKTECPHFQTFILWMR